MGMRGESVLREWASGFAGGRAGWPAGWRGRLAVGAAAGLLLGLMGPFGSYLNPGVAARVAYWMAALMVGSAVTGAVVPRALRWAARRGWPVAVGAVAGWMAAALPLAAICRVLAMALWPAVIGAVPPAEWLVQTLVIGAPFVVLDVAGARRAGAPAAMREPVGLFTRLPPAIGREVLALQMEDHYVRVHTALGSALVLMPLRDAMREVAGVPGVQTHRSWWVARAAVAEAAREGRKVTLRLTNGVVVPVARAQVAAARAAGVLG